GKYSIELSDNVSDEFIFSYNFGNQDQIKFLVNNINKISLKNFNRSIFEVVNSVDIKMYFSIINEKNDNVIKNPALFVYEDEDKIYFRRFYLYEMLVVKNILKILSKTDLEIDDKDLSNYISPEIQTKLDTMQLKAIESSIKNRLTLISGGPGTGKTFIISSIIKLFKDRLNYGKNDIITIAPTGKAANRISEAIKGTDIDSLTIHRLLKGSEYKASFFHNSQNPIHYKIVIVDEASMIDLPLMAKLLDALPENVRLILSGDANQLSSVEAGRVFADILSYLSYKNSNYIKLVKSFRYREDSIVEIAKSYLYNILNSVDSYTICDQFINFLIEKKRLIEPQNILEKNIYNKIFDLINIELNFIDYYKISFSDSTKDIVNIYEKSKKIKFLSPVHFTLFGTYNINKSFALYLKNKGIENYLPIIITKNNYQLKLFNGDIGIVIPQEDKLFAYFIENQDENKGQKKIELSNLSNWEPAFCLTVHKSQGSEYDSIVLFLPENVQRYDFITLELIYTAITRAKKDFIIVSTRENLKYILSKKTKRFTGLFEKLKTYSNIV
ncbi:MAG: exodeoxyribonuclease V subunit alpha, partial [Exilispira sp.]